MKIAEDRELTLKLRLRLLRVAVGRKMGMNSGAKRSVCRRGERTEEKLSEVK